MIHSLSSLSKDQRDGTERIPGNLYLGGLTSIPKGFNPTVGGDLYLNGLASIPEGFNPTVGGILHLNGLTSIPKGFNPTVGGILHLSSLASIPEGFNPTVGGSLYLNGLTSTPEGFSPTVGGSLYLNGRTSIPEGFSPSVGGSLYLSGYVRLPTAGILKRPPYPLQWNGCLLADGILSKVLSTRGRTYRVQVVGTTKVSVLVTDGTNWSHGSTLKEAQADLVYKVTDRKPEQYRGLSRASELSFAEAVACYRCITGACAEGVKWFVKQTGAKKKSVTIQDIIEKTAGQYGHETFKNFFGAP
jgi:hypothetical protein